MGKKATVCEKPYLDDELDACKSLYERTDILICIVQAQREKIYLEESDEMEDYGSDTEEAVMDLPNDSESEELESWGRNKKSFYSADAATEDLTDEAHEARKLQKRQLLSMKEEDFVKSRVSSSKSGPVTLELSESEDEVDEVEDRFANESDLADLDGDVLPTLLPEEEQLNIIAKYSPETKRYLEEFHRKVIEVKTHVEPLLAKLKSNNTEQGLSFLETKYQLLIGYCANLAYYLLLKVRGKNIERHPVIERLIKYRLLIEKIKPLESKLQYRVEKLLKAASNEKSGRSITVSNDNGDDDEVLLAYRPNMEMLEAPGSGGESASDAEDAVYKAPKVAPVHFNNGKSNKEDKLEERERMLASKSRLLADIQADIEDRPEEDSLDPVYGRNRVSNNVKKRDAYEEENFVRLALSKKELRKLEKEQAKPVDELEDLHDFFRSNSKSETSGRSALERLLGTKSAKKARLSGDEDLPKGKKIKVKKQNDKVADSDSDMSEIEDDMGLDGEDEMYKSAKLHSTAKKNSRSNKPTHYRPIKDSKPGESRPASYMMMKNRGLTPSRPKEVRNPRVRNRNKWERAQKKIKSFKSVASAPSKQYTGESSGIRTNITRSAKF